MRIKDSVIVSLVTLVSIVCSGIVQAEDLNIMVTRGYDTKTNIAIVPFYWEGGSALPEDVHSIIDQNLTRTGRFEALPPRNMLTQPTSEEAVFYRDWRLLNQEYLVIGSIEPVGNERVKVNFALYDVVEGQRVVAGNQTVGVFQLRDLAHSISDLIHERITGVKGIFSTKIAFVTRRPTTNNNFEYRLQVADADGQRARTVYRSNEPIISPTWSHSGRRIAFANKVGDRWKVFVQELSTGRSNSINGPRGYTSAPSFSPDGRYLAYVSSTAGNPELYLYDFSSGDSTRLTQNNYIDTEPSFSPDSKSLVYTSERGGSPQIYQMDLASKRAQRLTFEGSQNLKAQYSSDGEYLVFVHQINGRFHVAAMDLASREIRILTETNLDESPSIAPNGTMLVYATKSRGRGVLAWVSLDGQVTSEMPSIHGDVIEPSWSPYLN